MSNPHIKTQYIRDLYANELYQTWRAMNGHHLDSLYTKEFYGYKSGLETAYHRIDQRINSGSICVLDLTDFIHGRGFRQRKPGVISNEFRSWLIKAVSIAGQISGMRSKNGNYTTYGPAKSTAKDIGLKISVYNHLVYVQFCTRSGEIKDLIEKYSMNDWEDALAIQSELDSVFGKEFYLVRIETCDYRISPKCTGGRTPCSISRNDKLNARWQCIECGKYERQNALEVSEMSGYVYFIGNMEEYPYVKIGRTNNLKARKSQISIEMPVRVDVIHSIVTDSPKSAEKHFHELYKEKRRNGEWFSLTSQDIDHIKSIKSFFNGMEVLAI